MTQTQILLQKITFSVGICALTEVETTLRLVGQIMMSQNEGLSLREIIIATPSRDEHTAESSCLPGYLAPRRLVIEG